MSRSADMNIAVIGAGVFGALAAIRLAEAGRKITLFEREPDLLHGTSGIANRVHLGYHYPRDERTARQCMKGYERFLVEFGEAVLERVQNAYFIARDGSLVTPEAYLAFCDSLGFQYRQLDLSRNRPPVQNVEMGILTNEAMFDPTVLRSLMSARLRALDVDVRVNTEVVDIESRDNGFELTSGERMKARYDGVVNCCYADVNRLTERLGHLLPKRQYEYVAAPVVELDLDDLASLTVLDGPFVSLLPYGTSKLYLMCHVDHSVISRADGAQLDPKWRNAATSPFACLDKSQWLNDHIEACGFFIPALREARIRGVAQGVRMVLADHEQSDARPSFITHHQPGYVSVFAGKIDHAMWIADAVVREYQ
jgi:glycerol-3-phosphate dehydrogenase